MVAMTAATPGAWLAVQFGQGSVAWHELAAQEPASRRLQQLSDEVGRIAATLARLSSGPSRVR